MILKKSALVVVIALLFCQCSFVSERGNGDIITERFEVEDFVEIDLEGSYEVTLVKGANPLVEIETDENLFEFIEVFDRGRSLVVKSHESLSSSHGILVTITYTDLRRIFSGGASKVSSDGIIETDALEMDMAGAGYVDLEVEAEELRIEVSGAGSVQLAGQVDELDINMSGAGDLEAYELKTKYCDIDISGVGGAEVYVTEELDASVSGVGGVSYIGDPVKVRRDVSGLGNVKEGRDRRNI